MKRKTWLLTTFLLMPLSGCTGMNNTEQGALSGGLIGGALGAIVGGRHPLAAAAIGAGAGTIAGAAIGNSEDRRDDRRKAEAVAVANAQAARQMTMQEVVQMAQQNTPEQIIINQIESTRSNFDLRADDILFLRQQGVSDRVISVMQARRYTRTVVVDPRYVYPPPYYEPSMSVGIYGGRRW